MNSEFISFSIGSISLFKFVHIAGVIIALGSVMVADSLLVWLKFRPSQAKFIGKITPFLSLHVWIGLILISISGLFMFLANPKILEVSLFKLKMLLVLVIFINGIFLNLWVTPNFLKLVPEWENKTNNVRKFTIIAGISTAISFIAWWGIVVIMNIFY